MTVSVYNRFTSVVGFRIQSSPMVYYQLPVLFLSFIWWLKQGFTLFYTHAEARLQWFGKLFRLLKFKFCIQKETMLHVCYLLFYVPIWVKQFPVCYSVVLLSCAEGILSYVLGGLGLTLISNQTTFIMSVFQILSTVVYQS